MKNRYLILGGAGAIGSELTKYFENKNCIVDVIDIALSEEQNLMNLQINELSEYECIYFLAWDVGGSKYISDKKSQFSQYLANINISSNVFPQLHDSGTPFVFVSSQLAGFDQSAYSLTKILGEKLALEFPNSKARVVRQWNVYGVHETHNQKSHVISDMINSAVAFGEIRLLTDGREKRQFVHISDVCKAYDLVSHLSPDIYQVRSGHWIEIIEVAKILGEILNVPIKTGKLKGSSPEGVFSKDIPGWTPQVSLHEGLQDLAMKYT